MAKRYEYYITGGDVDLGFYGNYFLAQTFTPSISHNITSVKLYIKRTGSPAGNVDVSIRATSGGVPTGSDLCSKSVLASTISTSLSWVEFTFTASYHLNAEVMYAIVIKCPDGTAGNQLQLKIDDTSSTYSGGTFVDTSDGGANWGIHSTKDMLFEEWGTVFGQINIGDVWKQIVSIQINIGDVWKDVTDIKINIGDVWKDMG